MGIPVGSGVECFTVESHASKAFLETTNVITFTDEDMEVKYPDHWRSLYLTATIYGLQIKKALIDIGASLNLIALSTLEAISMAGKRILGASVEITGFGGAVDSTEGYVQLALRVGPIVALTRFYMINSDVSYHIFFGRLLLHKNRLIPSTYHQCVKGRLMRIIANLKPFNQGEVNFVETVFYDELVLDDECPTPGTPGALVLEEEEGVNTHGLRDLLDRKRQKKEASSLRSQVCLVG